MKIVVTSILFILSMITSANAGETKPELHYLVREPKIKSAHPPLLMLLHGVGSNEEDLFSFAQHLPDKFLVISARAPIILGGNSFAWYEINFSSGKPVYNLEQEKKSRVILIRFIEQIKEKYAPDPKQVYLCGFSQGAIMSYSIGLTRPDLVKGIAIMSGRLLEEIKTEIAITENLETLKILISHGTKDNTLPVQHARNASAYLKTLNLIPTYKEYEAAHEINAVMFSDLCAWLK